MKQTLTKSDFIDAFRRMDRYDQFGYEALSILFNYFEECDPDMELDVVAICCDYAANTFEDIRDQYDIDYDGAIEIEDQLEIVVDYLQHHSTVCGVTADNVIVYCSAF